MVVMICWLSKNDSIKDKMLTCVLKGSEKALSLCAIMDHGKYLFSSESYLHYLISL